MQDDCIFCKIINKDISADLVYEDDHCIIINDIAPKAPVHLLIIPKKHIATTNDLTPDDQKLIGHLMLAATCAAKKLNIDASGYRLVYNCNRDGGQEVYHIHCHLLGGKRLNF
jgi:histidine triad (HIT) family protein